MVWDKFKTRITPNPTTRKRLGIAAVVLAVAYVAFGSYIWWAMNQPPETFGRVMAKMPGPVPFLSYFHLKRFGCALAREICRWEMQRQTSRC